MHGVPKDLNLSQFVGKTLVQLGIGEFQVQFRFQPEGNVSVEGGWELRDDDGMLIDRSLPNGERTGFYIHRLLGQEVVRWEIAPPTSFALGFSNGLVLRVFDNSKEYESFSIQPGDIYV